MPFRSMMSLRTGYALGLLVCLALLGFALYLQHFEQQDPCPLCILQRIAFLGLAAVFLIAAIHGPGRAGSVIYSSVLFVISSVGAAIAARHVWLQHLPAQQVPECGPGLEYMLQKLPLTEVLGKVFRGSGECAEVGWTFLGLSIAGWSLLWFVLFAAFAAWLAFVATRRAKEATGRMQAQNTKALRA